MKKIFTPLLTLAIIFSFNDAFAQQTQGDETPKTVIVKRSTDEDGATQVNKVVKFHTGDNKQIQESREYDLDLDNDKGKLVIRMRSDGEEEVFELNSIDELTEEQKADLFMRGITISEDGKHVEISDGGGHDSIEGYSYSYSYNSGKLARGIHSISEHLTDLDINIDLDLDLEDLTERATTAFAGNANCVALGVFVNTGHSGPLKVNRTIRGSGAEESGLESGDIIISIDASEIRNFQDLTKTLAEYEPGDIVPVTYDRDGVKSTVDIELRAWGDLPDYENSWRAEVTCGDSEYKHEFDFFEEPKVERKVIIIKKNKVAEPVQEEVEDQPLLEQPVNTNPVQPQALADYSLKLEDFVAFPNPTSGKFMIEFTAQAEPLTVSVFDATGKEVFRDRQEDFGGFYKREIDLSGTSRGTLIVSVVQNNKQYTDQVILQ